ncbi:uncharacterized protein FIBRA_08282 [Fibroporia radiculosa]|uniref:Uncharacterized protein n=1 Tax=Fibroporia radiculosa TaxID=599839 RepID=J4IC98_9APHY|nr:uncharacterized protein FIBRA_08282 [Fibroporia radiculosa]CCM06036.1 predicted protein [Fibroporia radiculosa]
MLHSEVIGAVVLACNGDRTAAYQDPITYEAGPTLTTPLGEVSSYQLYTQHFQSHEPTFNLQVQSYQLGAQLRDIYLDHDSPSRIFGVDADLVDFSQIHVIIKAGAEGPAAFSSGMGLLQGLFPPSTDHNILLSNGTKVVAPLGGYQYVPVETVDPSNDHSLESWIDCLAFEKHVKEVQESSEFMQATRASQQFFNVMQDFMVGRAASLENAYNLWDFVSTQRTHNMTYAYRLPPTLVEQARGWANFRENLIFSDPEPTGIGNSRTALSPIIGFLQDIAYNDEPLKLMIIEATYQPFISMFHMTGAVDALHALAGIPDFGSALVIELRQTQDADTRHALRFRFKNGTVKDFRTLEIFGHRDDIPLTEFIFRLETSIINTRDQWAKSCGVRSLLPELQGAAGRPDVVVKAGCGVALVCILTLALWLLYKAKFGSAKHLTYLELRDEEAAADLFPINIFDSP